MKKLFFLTIIAMISGFFLGKYTFRLYEKKDSNIVEVSNESSYVYMMKIGSYSDKNNMISELSNVDKYIYSISDGIYNAYVGITFSKKSAKKFVNIYNNENLSIEKVFLSNKKFISKLKKYDKLIEATEDTNSLLIIEKQILSNYEDMVIKNE